MTRLASKLSHRVTHLSRVLALLGRGKRPFLDTKLDAPRAVLMAAAAVSSHLLQLAHVGKEGRAFVAPRAVHAGMKFNREDALALGKLAEARELPKVRARRVFDAEENAVASAPHCDVAHEGRQCISLLL